MSKLPEFIGLSSEERDQKTEFVNTILEGLGSVGIEVDEILASEVEMAVHRDIQARRLPPNLRIPSRRNMIAYFQTIYNATGSAALAIQAFLSPGSWTSSGGTFKLAEDNKFEIGDVLQRVLTENGNARFLEVGGGYAGLYGREQEGYEAKGVGKLVQRFHDQLGTTVDIHLTNLTAWHKDLPAGVREHGGFVASTIQNLEKEGVNPEEVDVIYSQCAAYFDMNIDIFIAQASRLLKRSKKGGYLVFNGKTEEDQKILAAAEQNGLELASKKEIGGMNGTLYIFKKI